MAHHGTSRHQVIPVVVTMSSLMGYIGIVPVPMVVLALSGAKRINAPIINTPLPDSIAGRLINVKPGDSKEGLCRQDPAQVVPQVAVLISITGAI